MHPRHGISKTYLAWVNGFSAEKLQTLSTMKTLEGEAISRPEVRLLSARGDGALLRIDRLIERGNEVLVVDYKLRLLPVERAAYADQLRGYVAAVTPLYPGRDIRAGVATAQGEWIDLDALPKPAQTSRDDTQGALF
ncbi:hypothetical protein RCJ22_04980, partial [Vibrio sp. FNV 38]|nr:hypothetical protein [Vibrio sp. FNV 38]